MTAVMLNNDVEYLPTEINHIKPARKRRFYAKAAMQNRYSLPLVHTHMDIYIFYRCL